MSDVYGVSVDIGPGVVFFRPIECGPKGEDKRKKLERCYELSSEFIKLISSDEYTEEAAKEANDKSVEAVIDFFESLLVQNYGENARSMAEEIPSGWFPDIASLANLGRLPENFTKVGRPTPQK